MWYCVLSKIFVNKSISIYILIKVIWILSFFLFYHMHILLYRHGWIPIRCTEQLLDYEKCLLKTFEKNLRTNLYIIIFREILWSAKTNNAYKIICQTNIIHETYCTCDSHFCERKKLFYILITRHGMRARRSKNNIYCRVPGMNPVRHSWKSQYSSERMHRKTRRIILDER